MELAKPFIRLPFNFEVEHLKAELEQFDESDWMHHPSGLAGNSAIPLISLNGEDNNDFAGSMRPTKHLQRCEYMQQVMGSFDEVLARSRLMRLGPGAEVSPHVDFNYHWYSRVRIHIPITTTPEVTFYCGDEQMHMAAGECWIFDSWRWHKVTNQSQYDRVHLVIDTAGSARFWNLVDQMVNKPREAELIEYQSNTSTELRTERFNVSPVMSPGELEALTKELFNDVKLNTENDPAIVAEYQKLLRDLAKDWREVWHEHGISDPGLVKYRQLLDRTAKQMRPNPRVLVTSSNNVGINPVIMQRILRAALNTELLSDYTA